MNRRPEVLGCQSERKGRVALAIGVCSSRLLLTLTAVLRRARFDVGVIAFLLASSPLGFANNFDRQAQNAEAQTHADAGLRLAQAGNLEPAEAELRRAVELNPGDEAFLADLGTVLAMEKKFEESSNFFEQALKIDSRDAIARRYLAANLWQLRRFPEAKRNLEILLKQKPGDPQALLLLGMVSENMKDYATAARALASVPTLVREQPESIGALARSYYHLGQAEQARSVLEELQHHPAGPRGVFLGAQIADQMGDYATAEKMLASIQSTFPNQSKWGYSLALVEYHAKRFEDARNNLVRLIESGYKTAEVYNLLGWCDQELHEPDEARTALEQAIRIEPSNESNFLDLVKLLLAGRRFSAALEVAKRSTEAFPTSARAFSLKGAVELEMEQYTDSIRSYAQAVRIEPGYPEGLLGLAEAQSAASMTGEAEATLDKARRQFPTDARFPLEDGLILLKEADSGNIIARSRAEQMLRLALALDRSLPEAHYQLGNLTLKNGQPAQALRHLEAAARLNPDSAKVHFALARVYRRLNRSQDASREMGLFEKLKGNEPREPMSSPADVPRN
jgi:tetratricopeptide (TPR) repeat protein